MDHSFLIVIAASAAVVGISLAQRAGVSILTAFFLALPFPLALGGEQGSANVSVSDVLIGVALVTLLSRSHFRLGRAGLAVLGFLGVATASSMLATSLREIILGIGRMVLVTFVPLLVFANATDPLRELRRGLIVYCVGCTVLAGISLMTFATGGIEASMYTLGINKNSLGPIFGTAVVAAFTAVMTGWPRTRGRLVATYAVLASSAVGLLLTLSRGAWAGTAAGLAVTMFVTGRVKPAILGTGLLVPVLAAVWSHLPKERVEYATDVSFGAHTMQTRLDSIGKALDEFRSSPVLGVGIGLERRVEPHNVVILTLGETGIVGLVMFATMLTTGAGTLLAAVRRFRPTDPDRALMVAGLAAFTLFHVQTLLDVYWRRGVGAMSWACVGAAVAVTSAPMFGGHRSLVSSPPGAGQRPSRASPQRLPTPRRGDSLAPERQSNL